MAPHIHRLRPSTELPGTTELPQLLNCLKLRITQLSKTTEDANRAVSATSHSSNTAAATQDLTIATTGRGIAGYVRCSQFIFPAACQEAAARVALVAQFSALRQTELGQIAAEAGQVIDTWYQDIDRSGRAEYQDKRTGFEAMTLAARTGQLGAIFVWDLSRLFRDLVSQELWLQEMETLNVAVYIQDLPFAADPATRRLLRQELGMINEYQSMRLGSLLSAMLSLRVEQGLWVGRTYSQWGLQYDVNTKGFLRDEATAPLICRLFEQFNAVSGSASRLVRTLNASLQAGLPGALCPPQSSRWDVTKVLLHLRDPLYRRRTCYNGAEYDVPHLIPEVVAPAVLAVTDTLLAARQAVYDQCVARCAAPKEPYLYARILRCLQCSGAMQAYPKQGITGPHPGLRVLWICSDALRGGLCAAGFYLPQPRLTILLERGLRQAFLEARLRMDAHPLPAEAALAAAQRRAREQTRLHRRVGKCDERRTQCLESYALGLLTDRLELEHRLTEISDERAATRSALLALRTLHRSDPLVVQWKESELGTLQERFEAIWLGDEWLARDPLRSQLLQELGISISARISPMPKSAADKGAKAGAREGAKGATSDRLLSPPLFSGPPFTDPLLAASARERQATPAKSRGSKPYVPRQRSGLCELVLVCSRLGIEESAPLRVMETKEELQDYRAILRDASPKDASKRVVF